MEINSCKSLYTIKYTDSSVDSEVRSVFGHQPSTSRQKASPVTHDSLVGQASRLISKLRSDPVAVGVIHAKIGRERDHVLALLKRKFNVNW